MFVGFTKIYCNEIKLHGDIKPKDVRVMYGEGRKICIIDINDIPEHLYDRVYLTTFGIPKTVYEDPLVRFVYYFTDTVVYPYAINMTREEMISERLKSVFDRNYFVSRDIKNESSLIARLEYLDGNYYMNYYIHNNVINATRENKRHHKQPLLVNLLIKQKGIDMVNENGLFLRDIIEGGYKKKYDIDGYESEGDILKGDIELYNYQKKDVEWMMEIEKMVDDNTNKISYDYSPIYPVLDGEFYIYNENIIPSCVIAEVVNTKSLSFKGGNIISEVGVGKTLVALYAIIKSGYKNREKYDHFVEFGDNCNYFYKRGKMMGEGCKGNKLDGSLYCKEHSNTIFIDKRSRVLKNVSDFKADDFIIDINGKKYINTNSTLVCCPNQLCDQWVQEYYSKFKSNHRVLLIVTQDQYKNITLADILFSDIIIVSYNFLNNKSYGGEIIKKRGVLNSFLDTKFKSENTDDSKLELLKSKIFNTFDMFYWNRVILDEAHEIESMKVGSLRNIIYKFESRYKWNITGTPFPNKLNSFINLMTYNTDYITSDANETMSDKMNDLLNKTTNMINIGLNGNIIERCKNLFRRNTKVSIRDEYSGNIIREYIKLLEFTSQERSIYDSYLQGSRTKYSDFLIKLCCHPELNNDTKEMIKNCKTLNEIHKCMLEYNEDLMRKTDTTMDHIKTLIEQHENELDRKMDGINDINNISDIDNSEIREIKGNLQNVKKRYTLAKQKYDNLSRTYNYLKNSLTTLEKGDEITCPICLDEIESDNIAITKCGHKFCWDCIYETHRASSSVQSALIKCPSCNTVMTNKDVYLLKGENDNMNIKDVSELSKIIQDVKSTKIGNIIHFLKTTIKSSDKVILFSQWDELLHKVGDTLLKYNINLVYCNGTVYNRKKAISSFCKNDKVNLILLSSRNAASGINLTIANKIIFLEPIYGSKDYRIDVESQGIGRADRLGQKNPIDIYRFIIKDTIEQDILNNFVDDTKLKQLSLN